MPFVLPGERVTAQAVQVRKDVLRAKPISIDEPSPERIQPGCQYFTNCGGCHYQHARYEQQVAQKLSILREVFSRVGRIVAPEDIRVITDEPWGYRNRSQFHLDGYRIGYLGTGSHRVINVEQCPISSPKLNQSLEALHGMRRSKRFPFFVRNIEIFTNETEVQLNVLETDRPLAKGFFEWAAGQISGLVSGPLDYPAAGFRFRVSHKSFFQVNRFLIDALVEAAVGAVEGDEVLDLYAGVGLFTLPLAKRGRRVTAVESSTSAIEDLKFNAERAGVKLTAAKGGVEQFLASYEGKPDLVVADPPRAGLDKQSVKQLLRIKPAKMIIVACDPSTLARDVAALSMSYKIDRMTLIDLFPQTYHMETVIELSAI